VEEGVGDACCVKALAAGRVSAFHFSSPKSHAASVDGRIPRCRNRGDLPIACARRWPTSDGIARTERQSERMLTHSIPRFVHYCFTLFTSFVKPLT